MSQADGFVFVSSESDDAMRVEGLLERLNLAGVQTWTASRSILPGENWGIEITSSIERSDSVLVFLSESSVNSVWQERHIDLALMFDKTILPILLDRVPVPISLFSLQALDLTTMRDPSLAAELILKALPRSSVSDAPVATPEPANKGYMFLSYADQDHPFVDRLKLFLKDRGYAYWDYRESDRDYHVALSIELEEVITRAAAVACVLSPDWKKSKWTLRELFFADEAGKPYLLLLARAMGPTLATAGMTFINFESDLDRGFQQLDRDLQRKGL